MLQFSLQSQHQSKSKYKSIKIIQISNVPSETSRVHFDCNYLDSQSLSSLNFNFWFQLYTIHSFGLEVFIYLFFISFQLLFFSYSSIRFDLSDCTTDISSLLNDFYCFCCRWWKLCSSYYSLKREIYTKSIGSIDLL